MYLILRRSLTVHFVVLLMLSSLASAAPVCKAVFATEAELSAAIEANIQELASLRLRLDKAQAEGNSSTAVTALKADYAKKEIALWEQVKVQQKMTTEELRNKIKSAIAKVQLEDKAQDRNKEDETRKKEEQRRNMSVAVIDGKRAVFHPIQPGSFEMKSQDRQQNLLSYPVTLTKPYELMATPVTQIIWRKVAELANAKLGTTIPINPSQSTLGDLHPVEYVSFLEVQLWIKSLNELSEQKPAELADIIFEFQPGDKFRLPTEAEWEFAAREGGKNKSDVFFGNNLAVIGNYAHLKTTVPQPVATKLPLTIGDREFYGLIAHVWEFTADTMLNETQTFRGEEFDPHYFDPSGYPVLKGHSSNWWGQMTTWGSTYTPQTGRDKSTGFRLVREPRSSGGTP